MEGELSQQIRELEIKAANAVRPTDWTKEDMERLLELRKLAETQRQPTLPKDEVDRALARQAVAGTVVGKSREPELTREEMRLIQTVGVTTPYKSGRR